MAKPYPKFRAALGFPALSTLFALVLAFLFALFDGNPWLFIILIIPIPFFGTFAAVLCGIAFAVGKIWRHEYRKILAIIAVCEGITALIAANAVPSMFDNAFSVFSGIAGSILLYAASQTALPACADVPLPEPFENTLTPEPQTPSEIRQTPD